MFLFSVFIYIIPFYDLKFKIKLEIKNMKKKSELKNVQNVKKNLM
jgi:hypothetical protein